MVLVVPSPRTYRYHYHHNLTTTTPPLTQPAYHIHLHHQISILPAPCYHRCLYWLPWLSCHWLPCRRRCGRVEPTISSSMLVFSGGLHSFLYPPFSLTFPFWNFFSASVTISHRYCLLLVYCWVSERSNYIGIIHKLGGNIRNVSKLL